MSKKSATDAVSNVTRRTWNKEDYRARAEERESVQAAGKIEYFVPAPNGAEGPAGSKRAYLKSRTSQLRLDRNINKKQLITVSTHDSKAGGWYCETCDCLLRDHINYVDHINGKKHQRKLGYTMRVKKATLGDVKARFAEAKSRKPEKRKPLDLETYEQRLSEREAEEVAKKKARHFEKKQQKQQERNEQEKMLNQHADAAMLASMGFGSFGGSKK